MTRRSANLPLLAAARRLRGRAGRPRKHAVEPDAAISPGSQASGNGQRHGHSAAIATQERRPGRGRGGGALASQATAPPAPPARDDSAEARAHDAATGPGAPQAALVAPVLPRLLGLMATATYLGGLSPWTIRDMVKRGTLAPVEVPHVRRLLFDRVELDRVITGWAGRQPSPLPSGAREASQEAAGGR